MSKVFNMVGGGGGKNISSIIITGLESTDTITCTKDSKSYTAMWDSTAQHWEIVGLPLGTFTLTATNGTKTKTETVLIDIAGVYEIEMFFKVWLYKDGEGSDNFTAATSYSDWGLASDTSSGFASKDSDSLYFGDNSTSQYQVGGFKTTVDFSDYKELHVNVSLHGNGGNSANDSRQFCIYLNGTVAFRSNNVESTNYEEYVSDVSSYGSNTVLGLMCHCGGTPAWYQTARVSKVWVE